MWVSLVSSFNEDLIRERPWIPHLASCSTVLGLVLLDILVPVYHSIWTHVEPPLRPSYDSYILFVIYIFLPIPDNLNCTILGAATTICYLIVTGIMTYRLDEHIITKVSNNSQIEPVVGQQGLNLRQFLFVDVYGLHIFVLCQLFRHLFPFNE